MASVTNSGARRVQEFLSSLGDSPDGPYEVKELPGSTRTAAEAAASIGCTVAQIAKSLVFRDAATGQAVLVVASGVNRVDTAKIRAATGIVLEKPDGNFVKQATGFAIGGIPPAGHAAPLRTLLDEDLKRYDTIWAAAGSPFAVFRLTPDGLGTMTGGTWLDMREGAA
ncbi:YbaK/prolyl-tRNA synthetase associated region [Desulfovibrio sp. X2]|uniref:YbaK/EbsC family protein n=1 Tax=Desulfovibrio sp. X2 TaxID=941449 RepID=UPI0003586F49|nr:YbaK/EbsC family protein [Desulfovibrio sp. X2]EPR44488.1 YbaK/prolyl-tRNA synthetase associated region [Desulfovibrio sp. X2]